MTSLKLTPSESVTIRRSEPKAIEVEAVYGPGGSAPPAHFHPAQDVFRLAAQPRPVVQGLLALLAPLGRLRGYSTTP